MAIFENFWLRKPGNAWKSWINLKIMNVLSKRCRNMYFKNYLQ